MIVRSILIILLRFGNDLAIYLTACCYFMIVFLYDNCISQYAMAYTCTTCDAEFESAAAVTQHLPLHHDTCAVCNEAFDDSDSLREHVHEAH